MTCSGGVCAPTATNATLNVSDIENLLASGNVTVTTTGSGVQANDIDVKAPVSWSASSALGLDAHRSIVFAATVASAGTGGISLTTDGNKNGLAFPGGNITFGNTSSPLTINGKSYTLVGSIVELASAIEGNPNGKYALANSYDAGQDGTYAHSPVQTTFAGAFDGLGNAIFNLSIADTTDRYVGFFVQVAPLGRISDFSLSNSTLNLTGNSSGPESGTLAGVNEGKIVRVFAGGTVLGCGYLGGLVGFNNGEIYDSSAGVAVSTVSATCADVAGFAAYNSGKISGSSESGDVDGGGGSAGGLVFQNEGFVEHSHATGRVNSTPANFAPHIGGLVADNDGWITISYASGAVSGMNKKGKPGAYAGGLVGNNFAVITLSFATGSVSGGSSSAVGGVVGVNGLEQDSDLRVEDCYGAGSVNGGTGASVGGFIGIQDKSYALHAIASSYSTGAPTAKRGYVGGFAGADTSNNSIVKSYWDTTTSGKKSGTGNRGNEPGLKGLRTTQLQSSLPSGFSDKIWAEDSNINNGLPYLLANPPPK
jgi:hypothetical protein